MTGEPPPLVSWDHLWNLLITLGLIAVLIGCIVLVVYILEYGGRK